MTIFWSFVIAIICASICYSIAEKCGKNTFVACMLGAIFNFIAVIGYGCYYIIKK